MDYCGYKYKPRGCTGGWEVIGTKPVLGPGMGTVNDPLLLRKMDFTVCGFPGEREELLHIRKARMEYVGIMFR